MAAPVVTWDTHWARHLRLAWDYLLGGAIVSFLVTYGVCTSQRAESKARIHRREPVTREDSSGRHRRNSFNKQGRELEREPRHRHYDRDRDNDRRYGSSARASGGRRQNNSDPDVDYSD